MTNAISSGLSVISTPILAASSGAPIWLATWIIVLALIIIIGAPIYHTRRRQGTNPTPTPSDRNDDLYWPQRDGLKREGARLTG